MLFNSEVFLAFFAVVYLCYVALQRFVTVQNRLLLLASYVFYGYWDYRFLSLLLISTAVDFVVGRKIFQSKSPAHRKILLAISVTVNLTILGFFKYFNFFAENFAAVLSAVGMKADWVTLTIILPLGISFTRFKR